MAPRAFGFCFDAGVVALRRAGRVRAAARTAAATESTMCW
jgi:hypothetical protein